MYCIMQKSFQAGPDKVRPGQLIDVSEWKNIDSLIEGRYMRRATKQEIGEAAEETVDRRPNRQRARIKAGTKVKIRRRS
jgi:hypothetical protein